MLGSKEKHWLMSVRLFFSLAQSVPRPILFVHSFQNRSVWASQSHDIGLNYFLPFSESVSPIPLDDLERTAEKKKKRITEHPELQQNRKRCSVVSFSQNSEKWNQPPSSTSSHTTSPVCFISIHHVSLFFWPETVAPPEVQLVLALISCVWHAQTAWVSVYTARSTLYITHTGSRNILNCFRHREEQDISVTGAALFSNNNQFI